MKDFEKTRMANRLYTDFVSGGKSAFNEKKILQVLQIGDEEAKVYGISKVGQISIVEESKVAGNHWKGLR